MTGDVRTFHAPALVAQALIAVFSVGSFLGVVALYLDVFLGWSLLSWQVTGSVILVSAAGLAACWWWVTRPGDPVLIVDTAGLDWRLSVAKPVRLGWAGVAGYTLYMPDDLARIGHAPPPDKCGERCLAVYLRGRDDFLAAYEADMAPGLDDVLAALRQHRPDLEFRR